MLTPLPPEPGDPVGVSDLFGNEIRPGRVILYPTVYGSSACMNLGLVRRLVAGKTGFPERDIIKVRVRKFAETGYGSCFRPVYTDKDNTLSVVGRSTLVNVPLDDLLTLVGFDRQRLDAHI